MVMLLFLWGCSLPGAMTESTTPTASEETEATAETAVSGGCTSIPTTTIEDTLQPVITPDISTPAKTTLPAITATPNSAATTKVPIITATPTPAKTPAPTAVVYPTAQPTASVQYSFSGFDTDLKTYSKLPSPFRMADGSTVSNMTQWNQQREYIKQMLCYYVYGPRPNYSVKKVVKVSQTTDYSVSSNAQTTVYKVYYDTNRFFRVRITRPTKQKVYPVIMRYESNMDYRFCIENSVISNEKYVIVAINNLDAYNDSGAPTQSQSQMYEYKAIMAWAYQATLTMDFLSTLDFIDMSRIAITGHSRTGKAALCAAAYDERIALTIPNSSGAAGAATLRKWGQDGVQGIDIASQEPYWISGNLSGFTGTYRENIIFNKDKVDKLPLDMNFARVLIAPRPILCTESRDGADSLWAGPYGTYTAWAAADPVYKMYGAGQENNNLIHTRAGQHDQLESDYLLLLQFCDYYFYRTPFERADYRVNTEYSGANDNFDYTNPF